MKREVDSTLVEKGVAERVRLTQMYEKKRDELQRQHEHVKTGLINHKAEVILITRSSFFSIIFNNTLSSFQIKKILEREVDSNLCISEQFLSHFNLSISSSSALSSATPLSAILAATSTHSAITTISNNPTNETKTSMNNLSAALNPLEL